jgi:hypothetical protein
MTERAKTFQYDYRGIQFQLPDAKLLKGATVGPVNNSDEVVKDQASSDGIDLLIWFRMKATMIDATGVTRKLMTARSSRWARHQ